MDRSQFFEVAPEMEFTGERIVPGRTAETLFLEHEQRYVFASRYVAGKVVLDVACGAGVGTSFLRRMGAGRVWGLDIAPDAIAYARARYPECEFAQSEATSLCLPDCSVDVVVSFETLEHVKDQKRFLRECWRVLRPGGLLICSTPNTTIYRWQGGNPFHIRELTLREFADFVSTHFEDLRLFSQDERLYTLYVLRRLVSRTLEALGLKETVKKYLRPEPSSSEMREEFSVHDFHGTPEIRSYRKAWLRQPMYLIAVGRKASAAARGNECQEARTDGKRT